MLNVSSVIQMLFHLKYEQKEQGSLVEYRWRFAQTKTASLAERRSTCITVQYKSAHTTDFKVNAATGYT